jgi:uncharacterized protein YjbJ (UPF0337 family)
MDTDRIKGEARRIYGAAEDKVGGLTGDSSTRAQGVADQALGAAQNSYGRIKDTARDLVDRAPGYDDIADAGRDYMRQGGAMLRSQAERQPLGTIVLAAAVGFFVAWMFRRGD